jgi:hypothetical protein
MRVIIYAMTSDHFIEKRHKTGTVAYAYDGCWLVAVGLRFYNLECIQSVKESSLQVL